MGLLLCKVVNFLLLLLVLCMLQAQLTAGCNNFGRGCYKHGPAESAQFLNRRVMAGAAYVERSRKTLEEIFRDNTGREHAAGRLSSVNNDEHHGDNEADWELRKVPSGPNPLHHHGGSPTKPQTP